MAGARFAVQLAAFVHCPEAEPSQVRVAADSSALKIKVSQVANSEIRVFMVAE